MVNVLANLIAAAVIYLAAVLAGYITADRIVTTLAVLLVLTSAWQLVTHLTMFDQVKQEGLWRKRIWLAFAAGWLGFFIGSLFILVKAWTDSRR